MFAGKTVLKAIVFIIAGISLASIAVALGSVYIPSIHPVIVGIVAFIVGGALGLPLLPLGIGIALAITGYTITSPLVNSFTVAVAVAVILFIIGIILTNKILIIISVIQGAMLMIAGLNSFGLPTPISTLIAIILAVVGVVVQGKK